MIQVGQVAPDFKLFSSEKEEVSLSSFKGKKVVILFYPQAFTSTCTEELCFMRDHLADYEGLNSVVLGISVDSVFTLAKYKEEQKYNFKLLSDFNKEVSTMYGVLHETFAFGMKGVSKRSAFVIDEHGIVIHKEILDVPNILPNFEDIKMVLQN